MTTLELWRAARAMMPPASPAEEQARNAAERTAVRELEKYSAGIVANGMSALNDEHVAVVAEARTVRDAMKALDAGSTSDMTAAEAAKAWTTLRRARLQLDARYGALAGRLETLREPAERPVEYADRTLAQYPGLGPFLPPLT